MLAVRVTCHKLRQANIPHAIKSYDAKSAFHSGTLADLQEVTQKRLRYAQRTENGFADPIDFRFAIQDEKLLSQRRFEANMIIHGCDGSTSLTAGEGGLMGDSNEPELFMQNYYCAVSQYVHAQDAPEDKQGAHHTSGLVRPPQANASIGAFVDDIIGIVTPPRQDDRALAHR